MLTVITAGRPQRTAPRREDGPLREVGAPAARAPVRLARLAAPEAPGRHAELAAKGGDEVVDVGVTDFVRRATRPVKAVASRLGRLDIELTERCDNDCVHCCINLPAGDAAAG